LLDARQLEAERRLIEASQRQPRRFAQLYERYFDRIYAFALTRTGDRTSAEDVTAETFRQAFENLPGFEWRGMPFSAWLPGSRQAGGDLGAGFDDGFDVLCAGAEVGDAGP